VVWISETRPIRGAGSLDSLTRAALPSKLPGKGDRKMVTDVGVFKGRIGTMAGQLKDSTLA